MDQTAVALVGANMDSPIDDHDVETMDTAVLEQARLIFTTLLTSIKAMEFPISGKQEYISEVEREIDKIDIELLSRGDA